MEDSAPSLAAAPLLPAAPHLPPEGPVMENADQSELTPPEFQLSEINQRDAVYSYDSFLGVRAGAFARAFTELYMDPVSNASCGAGPFSENLSSFLTDEGDHRIFVLAGKEAQLKRDIHLFSRDYGKWKTKLDELVMCIGKETTRIETLREEIDALRSERDGLLQALRTERENLVKIEEERKAAEIALSNLREEARARDAEATAMIAADERRRETAERDLALFQKKVSDSREHLSRLEAALLSCKLELKDTEPALARNKALSVTLTLQVETAKSELADLRNSIAEHEGIMSATIERAQLQEEECKRKIGAQISESLERKKQLEMQHDSLRRAIENRWRQLRSLEKESQSPLPSPLPSYLSPRSSVNPQALSLPLRQDKNREHENRGEQGRGRAVERRAEEREEEREDGREDRRGTERREMGGEPMNAGTGSVDTTRSSMNESNIPGSLSEVSTRSDSQPDALCWKNTILESANFSPRHDESVSRSSRFDALPHS